MAVTDAAVSSTVQGPFWVAELFYPNGNSSGLYWGGGDRTHDKIYCAAQFPDTHLTNAVCELLNLRPLPRVNDGNGKFWRAVEHAWIEGEIPK